MFSHTTPDVSWHVSHDTDTFPHPLVGTPVPPHSTSVSFEEPFLETQSGIFSSSSSVSFWSRDLTLRPRVEPMVVLPKPRTSSLVSLTTPSFGTREVNVFEVTSFRDLGSLRVTGGRLWVRVGSKGEPEGGTGSKIGKQTTVYQFSTDDVEIRRVGIR